MTMNLNLLGYLGSAPTFMDIIIAHKSKSCLLELHEHDDVSHDDGTEAQKFPSSEVDVAQEIEGCRVGHPP